MTNLIELPMGNFEINSRGVVLITIENVAIDKDDIANALLVVRQLCKGNLCKKVIDARRFHAITREARSYWRQSNCYAVSPAIAIVVRSVWVKWISAIFSRITSHKHNVRYFTNKSDALAWIHSQ